MDIRVKHARGHRDTYNTSTYWNIIYFATDTHEILFNGHVYGFTNEDFFVPQAKLEDNKLKLSVDGGSTWTESDYIASQFRVVDEDNGDSLQLQISRDEGNTWQNIGQKISNSLKIKGYVGTYDQLPTNPSQGDIYGVGPSYDEPDNPKYRMYVYSDNQWVDNGCYTNVNMGIVQEAGDSQNIVMSQKATTEYVDNKFQVVDELPEEIDDNTFYFVIEQN